MDPKEELKALLASGIDLQIDREGFDKTQSLRKSAVLILFGRLDSILADPRGAESVPTEQATLGATFYRSTKPLLSPFRVPLDLDVLLQRRANGMRYHPGQIAFPGGGIDRGETPEAAAVREAHEETGLDPDAIEILGRLPEVPLPVSNNLVTPVIGWWSRPSEIAAVDHTEAVQVFRVPVAEMLDPSARRTGVLQRAEHTFRSECFRLSERFGGHIVWGFTGILLSRLFRELGWEEAWDASSEIEIPAL